MASPQKENGFTAIANELFQEILKSDFTLRELKIIFTVIRFTYGYNKKEAELAVRFIAEGTGIKFYHISEPIKALQVKNVLILSESESHSQCRTISLNKDYESWKFNSSRKRNSFQKSNGLVPIKGTVRVPKTGTNKENNKENLKTYFEILWNEFDIDFGSKGGKKEALNQFIKLNPDEELFNSMRLGLKNQIDSKMKLRGEGKFSPNFPNVIRWLKNERWTDEIHSDQYSKTINEEVINV